MKRLVIFLVTVLYFSNSHAQAVNVNGQQDKDALLLKETEHDFANIPQGKPVYYSFEIVNNTGMPLKLEKVQASCGCTTPEWNKEAIPAGGTDKIKVGFNAAVEGIFEKQIT